MHFHLINEIASLLILSILTMKNIGREIFLIHNFYKLVFTKIKLKIYLLNVSAPLLLPVHLYLTAEFVPLSICVKLYPALRSRKRRFTHTFVQGNPITYCRQSCRDMCIVQRAYKKYNCLRKKIELSHRQTNGTCLLCKCPEKGVSETTTTMSNSNEIRS